MSHYSQPEMVDYEGEYATVNKECDTIVRETQCKSNKSCDWNGTCYDALPGPPVNRGEKPPPISRSNKPSDYDGGSRKRRSKKTKVKAKRSGSKRKTRKATRKAGRKAKRSRAKRSKAKRS